MNEKRYLAESLKYSSALVWHFAEIELGLFALYNHKREVVLVTEDWDQLLPTYRARSAHISPQPRTKLPDISVRIKI